jgi:cell division septation protein DedD
MLTINPDGIPDSPAAQAAPEAPAAAAAAPGPESPAGEAAAKAPAEEPKKQIPMAWIPATLGLGLLIAMVYLGGRIVTAKAHTSPSVQTAALAQKTPPAAPTAAPAPAVPAVQAQADLPAQPVVEPKPSPLAPPEPAHETKPALTAPVKAVAEAKPAENTADLADLPTITPQAGERYVQIGALIPKAAHRYLGQLHLDQLKPHVAPGPTPDLVRVLIGPFADRDVLAAVQAQLDAQGIQNFIRRY